MTTKQLHVDLILLQQLRLIQATKILFGPVDFAESLASARGMPNFNKQKEC